MKALGLGAPAKISRKVKSFLCASALSFSLFAIFPLTQANLNSEKKSPQKYIEINLQARQNKPDEKAAPPLGAGLPVDAAQSAHFAPEFSVLAPQNYGELGESKIAVEGEFGLRDFSGNTILSNAFELQIFSLQELDKIPGRKSRADIQYPRAMLGRGVEGSVVLSLFINPDGSVELERVVFSTNEIFEAAALKAVQGLIYEAPTMGNKPVRARFTLEIPFTIEK